jgi:hypothetical protein
VIPAVDRLDMATQPDSGVVAVAVDVDDGSPVVHFVLDAGVRAEVERRPDLAAHASPVDGCAGLVSVGVGALRAAAHLDTRTAGVGHRIQASCDVLLLAADVWSGDEELVRQPMHGDSQVRQHAFGHRRFAVRDLDARVVTIAPACLKRPDVACLVELRINDLCRTQ